MYLLGFRNPDLTLRPSWTDLGLRDDTCADVPAWWLLKKKRTMYATGATDSRSVRSLMQFTMHPLNGPDAFTKHEPACARPTLRALHAAEVIVPIDAAKADASACWRARACCRHGTYGATTPESRRRLVEIGTDPVRHRSVSEAYGAAYAASWFGREAGGWFVDGKLLGWTPGYQAPPLDGVWATAPYLHNGSVPTLAGVLDSKARPELFTRSYRTGAEDYDRDRVGWKVTELANRRGRTCRDRAAEGVRHHPQWPVATRRSSGDDLTDAERRAVVEYLKTL